MSHRYLITGAGGQLGQEFARTLGNNGAAVHAFSSQELDITDSALLRRVIEEVLPDVIINCAAYTKVDQAEDEPERSRLINAAAVAHMSAICKEKNILLVHFSTDYVFPGLQEDAETFPMGYPTGHPGSPAGVYGQTKWEGEAALQESGCRHMIIRVSWLCGRFGNNFVKTMLRLGRERDELSVVNDQIGSPSFTRQVVQQTLALIRAEQQGIFHVASAGIISWYDLAVETFLQAGVDCRVNPIPSSQFPSKVRRPAFSLLDSRSTVAVTKREMGNWKDNLRELLTELEHANN